MHPEGTPTSSPKPQKRGPQLKQETFMNETIQTATADVNGTKLFYRMAGDPQGPPVLLWHGFLETSHCWHQVMTGLAEIGFAVIAADMRGYGDSDKPSGTTGYDARALSEEFRALVKQL